MQNIPLPDMVDEQDAAFVAALRDAVAWYAHQRATFSPLYGEITITMRGRVEAELSTRLTRRYPGRAKS